MANFVSLMHANGIVLVTGGAGFIGSNIAARLAVAGLKVVVVDRLGTADKWRNLRHLYLHDFVPLDGLGSFLKNNVEKISAIIHMGAISSTTERDGDRILRDNIRSTWDLWLFSRLNNIRFIYASSAATYGDGANGFKDDEGEAYLLKLAPLNLYGWSKHVVDLKICKESKESEGKAAQWAGLKFFNVYGPGEDHKGEMRSLINKIIPKIVAGERVELFRSHRAGFSDGGQLRDFVFVKDCVDIVQWLLERPDVSGLFNVGTGKSRTFLDLVTATYRAMGRSPNVAFIDMPISLRERYQYYTQADMQKIRSLGFDSPATTLEDGVLAYCNAVSSS